MHAICKQIISNKEVQRMARNEKTSKRVAKVASKVLRGKPVTKKQIKSVAGSALTQTKNRPKKKSR